MIESGLCKICFRPYALGPFCDACLEKLENDKIKITEYTDEKVKVVKSRFTGDKNHPEK